MNDAVFIYSLADPDTGAIRYIGKAGNVKRRLQRHLRESKKDTRSPKKAWVKSLLCAGKRPVLEPLDNVPANEWEFWEQYWISQCKAWGYSLTNSTRGGDGVEMGQVPWNKGKKGSVMRNSGTFKKGSTIGEKTRFRRGESASRETQFQRGGIPHNSIIVVQRALDGTFVKMYGSYEEAAKAIGVTGSAIRNCVYRKIFKCKSYLWDIMEKQP